MILHGFQKFLLILAHLISKASEISGYKYVPHFIDKAIKTPRNQWLAQDCTSRLLVATRL